MPRFFIESEQVSGHEVVLHGTAAAHLARSLRVQPGELIVVVEAGRLEHGVIVEHVTRTEVVGRIAWSRPATGEARLQVHVIQAIPAHGMRATVESLAEIGVAAVWPVTTTRGVVQHHAARVATRHERWDSIARESAQLAGRARPPEIHGARPLANAVAVLPPGCRILACVLGPTATPLNQIALDTGAPVAIVIGPEGGLAGADLELLTSAGAELVHLGPRVVPVRLAGFLAVSLLLARSGDLDTAVAPPGSQR